MQQRRVEQQEAELEAERRLNFRGTARIRLERLEFPRHASNENVERLKLCIEYEGCYRVESRYHVTALIDQQLLDGAIRASNTSHAALLSDSQSQWPTLRVPPGVRLECLRGWDRLRAGWESLPPKDRWWTVDLYLSGKRMFSRRSDGFSPAVVLDISDALKRSFREAFVNEGRPSDGKIYRHIRLYSLAGDADAEGQWWARLSKNKRQDLKRLLTQKSRKRYAAALDALLDIPGLWDGIRGGMWKKMMDLRCEEVGHLGLLQKHTDGFGSQEVLHYLEHIRTFWSTLLQNDVQWMRRLDHITVKALERKAPAASMTDLAFLYTKIQKGAMFHAFDEQERNTILHALKSVDGLVPSFDTFFEDFNYLRIWGQCAKTLVKVRPGGTVAMALEQSFDDSHQPVDHCIVQTASSDFATVPGSITDRVDLGYRQLFLYVMRHHREMMPGSTKMERRGRKKMAEGIHIPEEVDTLAWYRFAALADQLGFTSAGIASLKSMNEATSEVPSNQTKPSFVTAGSGESEERRSGRPYNRAYEQSQSGLFLGNVHSTDPSQGSGITPFFVRRSIYLAFLGHLPFGGPTAASPPVPEEWPPQHTRTQLTIEPDPGRGETVPVETTQHEDVHSEITPGGALGDPSALQLYLQGAFDEASEEERLMLNDVVPDEHHRPDRDEASEEERLMLTDVVPDDDYRPDRDDCDATGSGEAPVAFGSWPSEAPSLMGSSYYSEDGNFEGDAAAANATGAATDLRAANGSNARVKFILRAGQDWVDVEELSIDPADPSSATAVERVAEAHTSKRRFLFNTALRSLAPSECLNAVVGDGTNVVLLIPEGSVNINDALSTSARMLGMNA